APPAPRSRPRTGRSPPRLAACPPAGPAPRPRSRPPSLSLGRRTRSPESTGGSTRVGPGAAGTSKGALTGRRSGEVQRFSGGGDQGLIADLRPHGQDLPEHLGRELGLAGLHEVLAVVLHGEVEDLGARG